MGQLERRMGQAVERAVHRPLAFPENDRDGVPVFDRVALDRGRPIFPGCARREPRAGRTPVRPVPRRRHPRPRPRSLMTSSRTRFVRAARRMTSDTVRGSTGINWLTTTAATLAGTSGRVDHRSPGGRSTARRRRRRRDRLSTGRFVSDAGGGASCYSRRASRPACSRPTRRRRSVRRGRVAGASWDSSRLLPRGCPGSAPESRRPRGSGRPTSGRCCHSHAVRQSGGSRSAGAVRRLQIGRSIAVRAILYSSRITVEVPAHVPSRTSPRCAETRRRQQRGVRVHADDVFGRFLGLDGPPQREQREGAGTGGTGPRRPAAHWLATAPGPRAPLRTTPRRKAPWRW